MRSSDRKNERGCADLAFAHNDLMNRPGQRASSNTFSNPHEQESKVKPLSLIAPFLLPALLVGGLAAQDEGKEMQSLKQQMQKLQQQMDEMRTENDEAIEDLESSLSRAMAEAGKSRSGTTGFLFTGFATFGYRDAQGSASSFDASFSPIMLFKLGQNLFVESEIEFEIANGPDPAEPGYETEASLEYIHLVWAARDDLMIGIGKFLLPFGQFAERLHPAWINKLADAPLLYGHDGIIPMADVGIDVRGGFSVMRNGSINYALYLVNGPQMDTAEGTIVAGTTQDFNYSKALGGRLGFLPHPSLEIGFSFLSGKTGFDDGGGNTGNLDTLLLGMDLGYVKSFDAIRGTLDGRFEWARSDVDANAAIIGGVDNVRSGWYAQMAYRPDKLESFAKDLEGVIRYDSISLPSSLGEDRNRFTLGLNYWLGNSTVCKFSYQLDDKQDSTENVDAFLFQVAIGF